MSEIRRPSIMAEAVANVARRVNATVEEEKDTLDLSNCKLISFPDGVFRVLNSVAEKIHIVTLADNEMKGVTSKFFKTFTQLRDVPMEKLQAMPALKCINLKSNPLDNNLLTAIQQFPQTFEIQTTTDN
ncbi:leucine-rich repeat-containing protein 20 [Oncorhynchus tshawytscha]|uniref:leucine-rich repeat-containing protein 20 n=1 Tax=Oncorhynchus tshawytscha TaxID=74940 RepID=UPI001C3D6618|nr:leucine-rich repeat-containing protein 20 [Oncorhynchus tshawytscha]